MYDLVSLDYVGSLMSVLEARQTQDASEVLLMIPTIYIFILWKIGKIIVELSITKILLFKKSSGMFE